MLVVIFIIVLATILLIIEKKKNSSDKLTDNLIVKFFGKIDKSEYEDYKTSFHRDHWFEDHYDPYTKDYHGYMDYRDEDIEAMFSEEIDNDD